MNRAPGINPITIAIEIPVRNHVHGSRLLLLNRNQRPSMNANIILKNTPRSHPKANTGTLIAEVMRGPRTLRTLSGGRREAISMIAVINGVIMAGDAIIAKTIESKMYSFITVAKNMIVGNLCPSDPPSLLLFTGSLPPTVGV